jgi:hypothetical protein
MTLSVEQNEPVLTGQLRVHPGNAFPPKATAIPAPALARNAAENKSAGPDNEREKNVLLFATDYYRKLCGCKGQRHVMRRNENPASDQSFGWRFNDLPGCCEYFAVMPPWLVLR